MNNEDQLIRNALQAGQPQTDGYVPEFSATFSAAERRLARRRRGRLTGLAAAAAVAVLAFNVLPHKDDPVIYLDVADLTATTQWSAPSDTLLPTYQTDIYRELPQLLDSTEGVL